MTLFDPDAWPRAAFFAVLGTILAIGVAARIAGATGDLWVDEIWSLGFARAASGPMEILFGIHHDNNHWLNTLYLSQVGPTDRFFVYRIPAVLAGIGMLAALTLYRLKDGRGPALTAAVLLGASYFLVHYHSEARGYAPAMFFGVAAYLCLRAAVERPKALWLAAFAASAALGLLSQLTFVWVYAGLLLWSARAWLVGTPRWGLLAAAHSLPLATLATLFVFDVRHWTIGGMPPQPVRAGVSQLMAFTFGLPAPGWLAVAGAAAVVGVMAWEISRMARRSDPAWYFYLFAVLVGPALLMALMVPHFFRPRYVIVSLPFALLLVAGFLDRIARAGRGGRVVWAGLLAAFLLGNLANLQRFAEQGRGQYRAALTYIAESSGAGEVPVYFAASTSQQQVFDFYAPLVQGGERLRFLESGPQRQAGAEWTVVVSGGPRPPPALEPDPGRFAFERAFGSWGAAGWTWHLYRRRAP